MPLLLTISLLVMCTLLVAGCDALENLIAPAEERPAEAPSPEAARTDEASGDADVLFVRAVETGANTWIFHVTVEHEDTGWDDYADGWDVVLPDGTVVKPDPESPFTRLLLHPHEDEQPFTRSQSGIVIPPDVTQVTVRAHEIMNGFGGREVVVDLTESEGEDFTVERLDS